MKPNIGIAEQHLKESSSILAVIVSDVMTLYVKTLNFHWHVRGKHFGPLHQLFKDQYEKHAENLDALAERIRILGHDAPGSMKEFLELSQLKEESSARHKDSEMLQKLLHDQEKLIQSIRKGVDDTAEKCQDLGTSDFLTGMLTDYEFMAWATRSHLE